MNTQATRPNAATFYEWLNNVERTASFRNGRSAEISDGEHFLMIYVDPSDTGGSSEFVRHHIQIGYRKAPDAALEGIPCGVMADRSLVAARWTNYLGHFEVLLPRDERHFSLRFAPYLKRHEDVELLLALGDSQALAYLEDAREDIDDDNSGAGIGHAIDECIRTLNALRDDVSNAPLASEVPLDLVERGSTFDLTRIWAAETQPSFTGDSPGSPVGVRLKWESPDGTRLAILNRPPLKSASGRSVLLLKFYDQSGGKPRRPASDFKPARTTISGVDAETISPGQAEFVWEQLPKPTTSAALTVDGDEWQLIEVFGLG